MPTRWPLVVLAVVCAAVPVAPAQQMRMPTVEVHSAPDVDFTAFETYGWKDPVSAAKQHEVHTSIVWYVDRGLQEKGLAKIEDADDTVPDLFIRYYAKAKSSLQGTPQQSQQLLPGSAETLSTTTSFDFKKVRGGALILELQKADNTTVWRAGTDISRIDQKRIDAEVKRAVRMLLAKYPPKPAKP